MLSRISMNVSATMSSYSQYVSKKMFSAAPKGIMLNLNDMGNIDGANKKVTYRLILILYVINMSDCLISCSHSNCPKLIIDFQRKRWGRGIGSNRGKTSGHGHQKSRSTPRAFEGGQTPLYKRLPKIGFTNHG